MTQTGDSGSPPHGAPSRRRLGEVLVSQGVLTEAQLQDCLAAQKELEPGNPRRRLGVVVVDRGLADERQIATALASALNLPVVDLGRRIIDAEVARILPRAVAERLGVLILGKQGPVITVATADPTNVVALDDTRLYTGAAQLEVVVATESQVREHLGRAWSLSEDSPDVAGLFDDMATEAAEDEPMVSAETAETAPIVRLADVVFSDAVRARVSDVHVEPQHDGLRIRYRIDGLLRDVMTVPKSASAALVSRIKIVSGLDIAERRRPQDGRTRLKVDGRSIDARVSTLPTLHGEKVVVRLLARADDIPEITTMGMSPAQLQPLLATLEQPQGLMLITGPTGSGKTSTLYSAIQRVSKPERNIVTLEDPVEIQFRGITQVQVNEKAGMTFGAGLRSVLRQDPDVVLVGEVRDPETARLALEASLTGHLVLTTLHTNSAVAAVTRLVDMGVEPFLVASSLSLVVAQRLVRTPCATCAVETMPTQAHMSLLGLTAADLEGAHPKQGRGCMDCGSTGYRGRMGVYEVLPVTSSLRSVLLAGGGEAEIAAAAASDGLVTLRAAALQAAAEGRTTYEEVLRVTHVDAEGGSTCPTCSRAVAQDMVVCPWCAAETDRDGCSSCRRRLAPGWRVCPWCRTPAGSAAGHAHVPAARAPEPYVGTSAGRDGLTAATAATAARVALAAPIAPAAPAPVVPAARELPVVVEPAAAVEPLTVVEPAAALEPQPVVEPLAGLSPFAAVPPLTEPLGPVTAGEPLVAALPPSAAGRPLAAVPPLPPVGPLPPVEPLAHLPPVEPLAPVAPLAPVTPLTAVPPLPAVPPLTEPLALTEPLMRDERDQGADGDADDDEASGDAAPGGSPATGGGAPAVTPPVAYPARTLGRPSTGGPRQAKSAGRGLFRRQ